MKKCSSIYILLAFAGILIVVLCVLLFAYWPHFADDLSDKNADWGDFGQFFWGLGTMLLTALNVWVLFSVNRSLNEFNENLQTKQQEFEKWLEEDRQKFQVKMQLYSELGEYINTLQRILEDSINKENPSPQEKTTFANRIITFLWSLQAADWLPKDVQVTIKELLDSSANYIISEAVTSSNDSKLPPFFVVSVVQKSLDLYKALIKLKNTKLVAADFPTLLTQEVKE